MPAPRSSRAGNVSQSSRAPVAWATRLAASRQGRRAPGPPSRSTQGSPERSVRATDSTVSAGTGAAARTGSGGAGSPPSDQETSAGRIRVEIRPGGRIAAATPSAASAATSAQREERRTQPDTVPARASMSDSSGASYRLWYVAWSPTTASSGVRARRALCRLASPLARPGPRCSSAAAGRPAIRP